MPGTSVQPRVSLCRQVPLRTRPWLTMAAGRVTSSTSPPRGTDRSCSPASLPF